MFAGILIAIVTMACSYGFAAEQTWTNRAVVVERYTGTSTYSNGVITFEPGITVTIEKENGGNVFVVDGVWVPKRILATRDMFKRLDKWEGQRDVAFESVDLDVKYVIDSVGRVKFVISDRNGVGAFNGHLYKYKNVLWIKARKDDVILGQNIFLILPNGKLCSPDLTADCSPNPAVHTDAAR